MKKQRKGTTGVANVAALRDLQTQGITVSWNYLVGLPGETDDDYWEVVGQLPRLRHLQAPSGPTRIVLERFNPYFSAQVSGSRCGGPCSGTGGSTRT